jgi:hypothetical protein
MTAVHALANPTHASDANTCVADSLRLEMRSLSETLWDLRWAEHLPFELGAGCSVRLGSFQGALPFVSSNYAAIFEHDSGSPFRPDALSPAKARYYERCADIFEFVRAGETIGLLVCDPLDWSTYYVRSAAVLPGHQGRQLVQRFFSAFAFELLAQSGVARVDIDISPSNLAMHHIATRLRFNPTGTLLTDRWGALTRFTKFLSTDEERIFVDTFCSGVKYQLRPKQ